MPVRQDLWKIDASPERLPTGSLESEKQLEDMIVAAPEILSSDWMLIGRQEKTSHGKIVDLLAVAPVGSLVLIELKRGQTPWEVVAQALDYASWVERLEAGEIADIYRRFTAGRNLAEDFKEHSGIDLQEDQLNQTHHIVIVAAELDHYGFTSGGGGSWYSQTLKLLSPGDRVWVNIPRKGYVGVGLVTDKRQQITEFATRLGVAAGRYRWDHRGDPVESYWIRATSSVGEKGLTM